MQQNKACPLIFVLRGNYRQLDTFGKMAKPNKRKGKLQVFSLDGSIYHRYITFRDQLIHCCLTDLFSFSTLDRLIYTSHHRSHCSGWSDRSIHLYVDSRWPIQGYRSTTSLLCMGSIEPLLFCILSSSNHHKNLLKILLNFTIHSQSIRTHKIPENIITRLQNT